MAPFYGWGSTDSRLEALRGGSFLFKTSFKRLAIFVSFFPNFDPHVPTYLPTILIRNIWNKGKKSSIVGQEQKYLISTFT